MSAPSYSKAVLVFVLAASFYLYEFILQVAPSVMTQDIMRAFGVGAVGVGTISAFYFYAYAPMQLPAGVLFDRYGPRLLISLAFLVCAAGCLFFASTTSAFMASMGRFMIGFGSAFSFIGILILVAQWFPASQFALYVGISQLLASIGAICGEVPLAMLTHFCGWRRTMFVLASLGVVLSAMVWRYVEDSPNASSTNSHQPPKKGQWVAEWQRFMAICCMSQNWWVGLYAFCSWTPITVFGTLWVVPFIERYYHVSTVVAANASALIWIGIGVGSPVLGWLSDAIGNRRYPLMLAMLMGLIPSLVMIKFGHIPFVVMLTCLLMIGLSASGQTLSFALVKENNCPQQVGSASGFNNFAVVIGGALLQPVFGMVLSWYWDGQSVAGSPVYPVDAFRHALWVLPVCYAVGLWSVTAKIKETYPAINEANDVVELEPSTADTHPAI